MAHTFDTSAYLGGATSPLSANFTIGSSATLLVVTIVGAGSTNRAGGNPTYNDVALTQVDILRKWTSSPETASEMFYLASPATGTHVLSIPNTNTRTLYAVGSTYAASSGTKNSELHISGGTSGVSVSAMFTRTTSADGCVWVQVAGMGSNSPVSARSSTVLRSVDNGTYSDNHQFYLQSTSGAYTIYFRQASEDYGTVLGIWKEASPPVNVNAGTVTLVTTTTTPNSILGSIAKAVGTNTLVATTTAPGVKQSSIDINGGTKTLVTTTTTPNSILGSIAKAVGTVALILATINPSLNFSSTFANAGTSTLIPSTTAPIAQLGSIAKAVETSTLIATITNPGVQLGSIAKAVETSTLGATITAPNVKLSSISINANTQTLITSIVEPIVILSNVNINAGTKTLIISSNTPNAIAGSLILAGGSKSLIISTVDPSVIISEFEFIIEPSVLVTSVINPLIILGNATVNNCIGQLIVSAVNPSIKLSSINVAIDTVSCITDISTISCILNSLIVDIGSRSLITTTIDPPLIKLSSINVAVSSISLITNTIYTFLGVDIDVDVGTAFCILESTTPSVIYESLTIDCGSNSLIAVTIDPSIIQSSIDIILSVISCIVLDVVNPIAINMSTSVNIGQIFTVLSAFAENSILGNIIYTPTDTNCILEVISPNIHYGDAAVYNKQAKIRVAAFIPGMSTTQIYTFYYTYNHRQ